MRHGMELPKLPRARQPIARRLSVSGFILAMVLSSVAIPATPPQSLRRNGREGDRESFYHRLALFHAPIHFQDTEVAGDSQDEGNPVHRNHPLQRRGDFIARFDFDGDWNGLNNWANWAERPPDPPARDERARASLYYSVVETATHYFISYCSFHAQDREPRCSDGECHENDLEGGVHMIRKGPENGGFGTLWLMMYLAHDDWFTYLTPAGRAAGIRLGGKPPHETAEKAQHSNAGFIYDVVWRAVTPDGKIIVPRDPHVPSDPDAPPGTVFHPTTWQEPWGHGMYGWPGPDGPSPYERYRKPEYPWRNGFINGDGVIYYPSTDAGIPDYRKDVDIVPYALIDIFEPNGLWDRREDIDRNHDGCGGGPQGTPTCTWGYFGAFRGERWGTDKANAPWRWDHADDTLPPGMQAFDPLRLIEEYNDLSAVPAGQLSRTYTNNRYLGIPVGTRPQRPAPTASARTRLIAVRPGETFTLDGTASRTADLAGRGHLLYRWEPIVAGWSTPWIRHSLTEEGIHRIRLTVNDGDHQASDDVVVIVTSRKLFFDDFLDPLPKPSWQLLGQTWEQANGFLRVRRPGGRANLAITADQVYPDEIEVETLLRLDLLYPEAAVPFGVGLIYQSGGHQRAFVFGFVGTRRIESATDRSRRHLTEVAFYRLAPGERTRLGGGNLPYYDAARKGYELARWYHIKLAVDKGSRLLAKVWPWGGSEPEWMYSVALDESLLGPPLPALVGGMGTSGEATYDYLLVLRRE